MRADFYHLTKNTTEEALPALLNKAYQSKKNITILTESEKLEFYDKMLWTFNPNSWLPHSTDNNDNLENQPIILTAKSDFIINTPNNSEILFIIDDIPLPEKLIKQQEDIRILLIFNGNDDVSTEKARDNYKKLKENNLELHYWQQNEKGKWEEK